MRRVLTIGLPELSYSIEGIEIVNGGLCDPARDRRAAPPLYKFDIIILNPQSYSHYIFGQKTEFSGKFDELQKLKYQSNSYDYQYIINWDDRRRELRAAAQQGATIVWCLSNPFRQNFFGYRQTTDGLLSLGLSKMLSDDQIILKDGFGLEKKSGEFQEYFDVIAQTGWKAAVKHGVEGFRSIASTPEGYILAGQVEVDVNGWLVTPPPTLEAMRCLLISSIKLPKGKLPGDAYHGIFLCHTNVDKPFVRKLKEKLQNKGALRIWVDEAELLPGDLLMDKIQLAISKNAYFGIILSPDAVRSQWVKQELSMAFTREVEEKRVVIVPILYKNATYPV